MSFKSSGPKTRPERVKPPSTPPSATSTSTNPPLSQQQQQQQQARPRRLSTTSTHSTASSTSTTASFHSAHFPAAEEAAMLSASQTLKVAANAQFARGDYGDAITTYDRALAELPSYLDYELAVLQSNVAACHVRLEQWREAVEAAGRGWGCLERAEGVSKGKGKGKGNGKGKGIGGAGKRSEGGSVAGRAAVQNGAVEEGGEGGEEGQVVELPDDADEEEVQARLRQLSLSDERRADIKRIRIKLLLRRARARASLTPPSWQHLAGAVEDYKMLASPEYIQQLPAADQKTVRRALVELPPRVEEAKQQEVGEMMGKLKDLGNGILKPFGLSTDMFKMTQDPGTGGWSMAFDQGGGKGGGASTGG